MTCLKKKNLDKAAIDNDKVSSQNATRVNVAGERLDAFVVAEDLAGARRGHGGDHERVTHAIFDDVGTE